MSLSDEIEEIMRYRERLKHELIALCTVQPQPFYFSRTDKEMAMALEYEKRRISKRLGVK